MLGILFKNKTKVVDNKLENVGINDMLQASKLSNEEKFNNILKFANEILEKNKITKGPEHPIFDFIRILGRGLQSDYMKYVFYYDCEGGEHNVPNLEWSTIGFDNRNRFVDENNKLINFYDLKKEIKSDKKLNLSKDLILPWPWNRGRLMGTINNIGDGRSWGRWKQDYRNHYVELWLPIGLAWVNGGNHSIAMGIIQGGELQPEYYYDISELYKYIKCDGNNFIRTKTNYIIKDEILSPVTNVDFAAIFEIGRLLVERGISFI